MHVILASLGTDGDVLPYVGIGTRLRMRGHEVTLLASENFRHLAETQGLAFQPLASNEEMDALLGNPDFWHPVKTARLSAEWGAGLIRRSYDLILETAAAGPPVLVANPAILGARLAQERHGLPLASVILQPWFVKSIEAPPVMPGLMYIPPWAHGALHRLFYWILNVAGGRLVGPALQSLCDELGLPPIKGPIFEWWWSPQRILGLFPEWFAPPQGDWLRQIRLTGFPLLDDGFHGPLPEDVLNFCRAGDPPLVFSFGTGMMHAARLFDAAVEACRTLRRRGIFLTRYEAQVPPSLPDCVRHWRFVPLAPLLPHCALIVHHGGVGTLATALAAGTPQLVLPFAFDQPDNGTRIRKLGVGDCLNQSRASGRNLAETLERLLEPSVKKRSQEVSWRVFGTDGLSTAADWIEPLGDGGADGQGAESLIDARSRPSDSHS